MGAALVVVPAAPVAANPLCLDVLGLVELCLGGSPESAAPGPQPSEPDGPPSPDPSTPPDGSADPPESQEPEDPESPAPEPSTPATPAGPPATEAAPGGVTPAGTGAGSAARTTPEAAPTPVPSATATPAPVHEERLAEASIPMIVIGDRGTPPAPGTVPMFAAGITLVGAGALAAGGILFARKQTDGPEAGPRLPSDR